MVRVKAKGAVAIAALMMGGCAAAVPPVEVTRFHTADTVARGTVVLVPEEAADAPSLEYRTFANAVAKALTRAGFTVTDGAERPSDLQAVVGVARDIQRPAEQRRSPVSVGVGGATGSYGSGLGLGVGINLSGKPKAVIATQLRVRLVRQSDKTALWEGRAETAAKENAAAAQPGIAAGKLADALFRDYPGRSGATITVK